MRRWYHRPMPKTRKKPDTETVSFTYDELEVALVALALRQEELRDARSPEHHGELELIWNVTDRMDVAQRKLEGRMTRQVETWLESMTETTPKPKAPRKAPAPASDGLLRRLSRLMRL